MSENLPFDNSPWILVINKPPGPSSYDCLRELKPLLFQKLGKGKGRRKLKIGHFGTLDPFAEGLLLVGTGKALKLMSFFQEEMLKGYQGVGLIGASTMTGDSEGEVLKEGRRLSEMTPAECDECVNLIQNSLSKFLGTYWQKPPYFSAVKHEGKPLYEYARQGEFIDKPPVKRTIHGLEVHINPLTSSGEFKALVSSGTYIRGLWLDLLQEAGLEGHLTELRRDQWGDILLDKALAQSQWTSDQLKLYRPDELWSLPIIDLDEDEGLRFIQGQTLIVERGRLRETPETDPATQFWVKNKDRELIGLGHVLKEMGEEFIMKVKVNLFQ